MCFSIYFMHCSHASPCIPDGTFARSLLALENKKPGRGATGCPTIEALVHVDRTDFLAFRQLAPGELNGDFVMFSPAFQRAPGILDGDFVMFFCHLFHPSLEASLNTHARTEIFHTFRPLTGAPPWGLCHSIYPRGGRGGSHPWGDLTPR